MTCSQSHSQLRSANISPLKNSPLKNLLKNSGIFSRRLHQLRKPTSLPLGCYLNLPEDFALILLHVYADNCKYYGMMLGSLITFKVLLVYGRLCKSFGVNGLLLSLILTLS